MFTRRSVLCALTFTLATFASPNLATATSTDDPIIGRAIKMLSETKAGASSAKYLNSGRVTVKFAKCKAVLNKPTAACFTPQNRSIYLSPSLRNAPVSVVAAYLAHEASHASRAIRTAYQFLIHSHTRDRQRIFIDEEMIAYKIQAQVWRELRNQDGILAQIFVLDRWLVSMDNFTYMLLMRDEDQRRNYISAELGYAKYFRSTEMKKSLASHGTY